MVLFRVSNLLARITVKHADSKTGRPHAELALPIFKRLAGGTTSTGVGLGLDSRPTNAVRGEHARVWVISTGDDERNRLRHLPGTHLIGQNGARNGVLLQEQQKIDAPDHLVRFAE